MQFDLIDGSRLVRVQSDQLFHKKHTNDVALIRPIYWHTREARFDDLPHSLNIKTGSERKHEYFANGRHDVNGGFALQIQSSFDHRNFASRKLFLVVFSDVL